MDDFNLDLDQIESQEEKKLQVKDRFAKLSSDYSRTQKEKEEAEAKLKAAEEARTKAERDVEFFKNFSQVTSKHPEASNFQDQILERVNKGMDTEEATVAVLYKEGKLGGIQAAQAPQDVGKVAGGSAPNTPSADKDFYDMNLEEKRNVMNELEKTGELERLLARR